MGISIDASGTQREHTSQESFTCPPCTGCAHEDLSLKHPVCESCLPPDYENYRHADGLIEPDYTDDNYVMVADSDPVPDIAAGKIAAIPGPSLESDGEDLEKQLSAGSDFDLCDVCVNGDNRENCRDCKDKPIVPPPAMTEGENGAAPKIVKDKPSPSLIPWDILDEFVEPAYQEGIIKYVRESWRRGFKILDLIDALERHKGHFMAGQDYDQEAKEVYGIDKHHLAAMVFCCLSALHTLKYHPELDNRFDMSTGKPKNE